MTRLYARFTCWRRGHDWRPMTTDKRHALCWSCCKQAPGTALPVEVRRRG